MAARSYDPLCHDGACYRAAVQPWYSEALSRTDVAARTNGRITNKQLDMLSGHGLMTLEHFLQSAFSGLKARDTMVEGRDKRLSDALIDSGGYQISTGAEKYSERTMFDLLRYSEQFEAAPILDGPTSSIFNPKSFLRNVRECFDFTVENARYAISNRIPGKTRLLNVIQGLSFQQAIDWFEAVKFLNDPYSFGARALEDWAFAGATRTYFSLVLTLLVMMRDQALILPGARLHFLGVGHPEIGCGLTAIQDGLRATVDEAILVSFDTATPFLLAGRFKRGFGTPSLTRESLYVPVVKMPVAASFVGSTASWKMSSPFADRLTLGDLNFHASGRKTSWDDMSHAVLAAHNVWALSYAVAEANRRLRLPVGEALAVLPSRLIELTELVREILHAEKPMSLIRQHRPLLDSLAHKSRNTRLVNDPTGFDR